MAQEDLRDRQMGVEGINAPSAGSVSITGPNLISSRLCMHSAEMNRVGVASQSGA